MGLLVALRQARPQALILALALVAVCARSAGATERFEATSRHDFADVEHWTRVFDDPERDSWQRPDEITGALSLELGMTVVDLGAGTGYFERRLSHAVGPTGSVFAVETEPNLVAHLRARAEHEATANVIPVLASFDNPRIPSGAADRILLVDTYHHIDDRLGYFRRLKLALRPAGRILIVDWKKQEQPVGPKPPHKLARQQVIGEMTEAGYALDGEPVELPYHYALIFSPRSD